MALLFHIDESIQTSVCHVHLGVLADGSQVAAFQKRLEDLRWDAIDARARGGFGLEFHGYEMVHQAGDWERVQLDDAIALMRRALQAIPELELEIIIRSADLKSVHAKRGADCDIYRWMFSNLLERLNERLRARKEYGLVIADEQHQHAPRLKVLVNDWQRSGTGGYRGQVLDRVLDAAHFVDSQLSAMTQLADMAAFVHRRRLYIPKEGDPRAEAVMSEFHDLVMSGVPDPSGQFCTTWYG